MTRSKDPADPPVIRPNFLSDEYDRSVTIKAFRWLRRLMARPELARFIDCENQPGSKVQSDDEIVEAARQDGNCSHAVGTCRMGSDERSVVDEQLFVRGVTGLRVADASIIPSQVSANPNSTIMAMAWRAADIILGC